MGFINFFKKLNSKTGAKSSRTFSSGTPLFLNTNSKNIVTEEMLMTMPDIVAAIHHIGDDVAKAKLSVSKIEFDSDKGTKSITNIKTNNLTYVLTRKFNDTQSPAKFMKMYINHVFTKGRFAAMIVKKAGVIKEIIPLDPDRYEVSYTKDGDRIFVITGEDGNTFGIPDKDVLFIPWEEAIGYTDVDFRHQFQSMLSMFADLYALDTSLLSNKTNFMAHIKVPEDITLFNELDDDGNIVKVSQLDAIRGQYESMVEKAKNTGSGVMVTDAKWEISPFKNGDSKGASLDVNAQKDMIRKLSRAFKIPMSYLGYQEDASTDTATTTLNYLKFAVQPWIELLVQEMNMKFFANDLSKEITYSMASLLKLSHKDLADIVSKLANSGAITINELRSLYLDLPTVKGYDIILGNSTLVPVLEQADKIKAETAILKENAKNAKNGKGVET